MGKKSGLVMSAAANRPPVSPPKAQVARSRPTQQPSCRARSGCPKVRFIIPKCSLEFRTPVSSPRSGEVKFASGSRWRQGMRAPTHPSGNALAETVRRGAEQDQPVASAAWGALPPIVGGVDWQVDVGVQRDGESGNMAVAP